MNPFPAATAADYQLPAEYYYEVVHTLHRLMPPANGTTPEDLLRRDRAAIAQVAALVPANAEEAVLGAHFVAAGAYAMHCLCDARDRAPDSPQFHQLMAEANGMMRQERGYRSLLLRVQAARVKREATNASRDSAALTEHCALGLMLNAVGRTPAEALVELPPPEPTAPPIEAAPDPEPEPEFPPEAEPQLDPAAEAEMYAVLYPHRAELIRRLGGLPADCSFGPPEPHLVHAIVTGTSPGLRALDRPAAAA